MKHTGSKQINIRVFALHIHPNEAQVSQPTSIDLFAGCGGLSLGLHKAGIDGIFAIERDAMAFETLKHNLVGETANYPAYINWPEWVGSEPNDIDTFLCQQTNLDKLRTLRGKVSIVAGGPPCQGFSVGGSRNGQDERNHLVHRLLQVVELVQPDIALIENVEGITRPFKSRPREGAGGSVADEVVQALTELGYDSKFGVVDASRFGVPQMRKRAIIIGIKPRMSGENRDFFGALEQARTELLLDYELDDMAPVAAADALADLHNPSGRVASPDTPRFESSQYVRATSKYAKLMRRGIRSGQIPDSHRYSNHGDRVLNLYKQAQATQPPGRLSKEFLLSMGTKKDKKVVIDPKKPVSTITTHPDEFIHYSEPRNITVREMARLQSFPDDFTFRGRYTINGPRRKFDVARCSQVGNAVPPLLAEAIGRALIKVLND